MTVDLRRLEEITLNASGPANPRFFDGWLLGFTPGRAKRGRSVNPFYSSSFPLATKIEGCRKLYTAAGLPFIVRLNPFVQPPEIEHWFAAAIPFYQELGFAEAYRYWYRARPEVIADERR